MGNMRITRGIIDGVLVRSARLRSLARARRDLKDALGVMSGPCGSPHARDVISGWVRLLGTEIMDEAIELGKERAI